jgi:hypothetical protein
LFVAPVGAATKEVSNFDHLAEGIDSPARAWSASPEHAPPRGAPRMAKKTKPTAKSRSAKQRRQDQTAEAIQARLEQQSRGMEQEVQQWDQDREALETETQRAEEQGASRQQQRVFLRRRGKLAQRKLRLLERNDELVQQVLERKGKLTAVMGAAQPTDADEMLWFLVKELKLVLVLEKLAPPETRVDPETGKEVQRRQSYPPLILNLLGLLGRYLGVSANPELYAVVLTDRRWMSLLGFNAQEVENGASRRSEALRGKTREGRGGRFVEADELGPVRTRLEGPRGVLSSQTIEGHESALEPAALVDFFNAVVRALARRKLFPKLLRTSLDSTGAEVVPTFAEAGVVKKKVKVHSKARRPRQLEVSVRGFKIWFLMEVTTGLPLAMTIDTIETAETTPAKALVDQARANVKGHGRITSIALDRGFLDGDFLWWLNKERRIDWVCPSKEGMRVTTEARERVEAALAALTQGQESALETAQRAARRGLSHQGVTFFERQVNRGRETLVIANVEELLETDFYGPGGSSSSRVNSKKFRPTPLDATVVLQWPDRHPHDLQDEREHDQEAKGPLVQLSSENEPGFGRFDRYDERSLIENRANRDAKQYFGLGSSLARNRQAFWSATFFSTVALMLYRGLQLHRERVEEAAERRGEALGVLRYRRQQMIQNRELVIVVVKEHFGIFSYYEFATLLGAEFS